MTESELALIESSPDCGTTTRRLIEEIRRLRDELTLWKPMTPEEAQLAYDAAAAAPMSEEQIQRIMDLVMDPAERMSNTEEAQLVAMINRLRDEKERRVYYQDIVYAVCSELDRAYGRRVTHGEGVACGTLGSPSKEVQEILHRFVDEFLAMKDVGETSEFDQ